MSMFEWPEPMLKAVIAEGLNSRWEAALTLPTAEARAKAKQEILKECAEELGNDERAKTVARLYVEVGPILAEHKAISKAAAKMPQIRNVAPEVLTPEEAVELMNHETLLPEREWKQMLRMQLRFGGYEMRWKKDPILGAWVDKIPVTYD